MVLKLPVQAARAAPVTVGEFHAAFVRIWNDGTPIRNKKAVGLAISGGVDSMALVSLCAKLQQRDLIRGLTFRAFVVDHGARAGSNEEAEAVSEILLQKGIETKILKIKWPQDPVLEQPPNFESLARKYRFRALGRACRDAKLDALFFAHHEDDQAETVLMRLAMGHKGSGGLAGIKARSGIPECYGIHGVHESSHEVDLGGMGGPIKNDQKNHQIRGGRHIRQHQVPVHQRPSLPMPFEQGGVMLYRPLLNFSKERLIATCLEDHTPWFEDHTNADPTMTTRNAIRHIQKYHRLPVALQKGSFIEMARRMAEKHNELKSEAMFNLKHCSVRTFQPRIGQLILRFPRIPLDQPLPTTEVEKERALRHHREVASTVIKVAASSISPGERVALQIMGKARKSIFPQLDTDSISSLECETAFTVALVKFERLELPKKFPGAETDGVARDAAEKNPLLQDHEWALTCQPYPSSPSQRPLLVIPPVGYSGDGEGWSLYDGRYWMRVVNRTTFTLHVRPLQKEDISSFEAYQPKRQRKLRTQLAELAPGNTRFMLPTIVSVLEPGREQVLALPTLEIGLPGVDKLVEWEVRYKKVDGLDEWIRTESIPPLDRRQRVSPCTEENIESGDGLTTMT